MFWWRTPLTIAFTMCTLRHPPSILQQLAKERKKRTYKSSPPRKSLSVTHCTRTTTLKGYSHEGEIRGQRHETEQPLQAPSVELASPRSCHARGDTNSRVEGCIGRPASYLHPLRGFILRANTPLSTELITSQNTKDTQTSWAKQSSCPRPGYYSQPHPQSPVRLRLRLCLQSGASHQP